TTGRCGRSAPEYTCAMPVILVLDDEGAARDGLVETLRRLFTQARVVTARDDARLEVVAREGASVVLASLSAAERLCREGAPPGGGPAVRGAPMTMGVRAAGRRGAGAPPSEARL